MLFSYCTLLSEQRSLESISIFLSPSPLTNKKITPSKVITTAWAALKDTVSKVLSEKKKVKIGDAEGEQKKEGDDGEEKKEEEGEEGKDDQLIK